MEKSKFQFVADKLHFSEKQVRTISELLADGATVPFIARYRKERTGNLDEVQIAEIRDCLNDWDELDKRRIAIIKSLEERELLTSELQSQLSLVDSLTVLEDIYLPYRPKRRTRAMIAREKGLEPLAKTLWQQADGFVDANRFVNRSKGVDCKEDAFAGAMDIVAEWIAESSEVRSALRETFAKKCLVVVRVADGEHRDAEKFRDYFDWQEPLVRMPSHRFLAVMRGKALGILSVKAYPDENIVLTQLYRLVVKNRSFASFKVKEAAKDAYKRLLLPSLENEAIKSVKQRADLEAIDVFASNMRELLLAAPAGEKSVLAIDPGFRTGCKCAVIDRVGSFVKSETIFPFDNPDKSKKTVEQLCRKNSIDLIAVGNGTAGRETEAFLEKCHISIPVVSTDESGASIYSASEVARKEFPELDLTVRGAISIGRRLQDPLSELVKLDPSSIGVGQYQHDVDQKLLKSKLDDVVISCVNSVGVDLNSASEQLLTYVSGLGPQLANNIVKFRKENGKFSSRSQLKKVPRLGPKAFEQAAAFLRVRDGKSALDSTAVHPESYHIVEKMARDLGVKTVQLVGDSGLCEKIVLESYVSDKVGLPTLKDIVAELLRPGRDPRPQFEIFSFSDSVHKIDDLEVGMVLPGIVTNVTKFGAFVDIGVHQDGLVHISQMADSFVKDPADFVRVRQQVQVTVLEVDVARKRISLSMR